MLEITMPLSAAALAFGLCVDYEVFLVSRMAEEWRQQCPDPPQRAADRR